MTRPPWEVAGRILRELFVTDGGSNGAGAGRTFPLAAFQEEGARRAADLVSRWGGVVIADDVGLGKTYIALALIEEETARGGEVVVAVPAALRPVWLALLRKLSRPGRAGLHLVSHAQLSRGSYPPGLPGTVRLLVVDEAHRFRNPTTRRYAALAELSCGARVVLLTATPINNATTDLHALLRLFLRDDAFVPLGIPSLHELAVAGPAAAAEVQRVLREVVVRRTRTMLGTGSIEPPAGHTSIRFPRRAPPRVIRFDDARVPQLVAAIDGLELAAYDVWKGDRAAGDDGGAGAAALIRLGLLKRLESGSAALARSVRRQLAFNRDFAAALEAGRLLAPCGRTGVRSWGDGDPVQLVMVDLVAGPVSPGLDVRRLLDAVRRDEERLGRMLHLAHGPDPKAQALRDLLASLSPERCVVFTEFRDTAEALWRALAPHGAVGRVDGGGAWLGLRPAGRLQVVRRFAPRSNGAPEPSVREAVRILIATDVLAEGLNLQDARHVVSHDLPWNPVRLMQRIGRVDRLGSLHDEVVPYLFLPAVGLEEILRLTRRLRAKLGHIAAAFVDDACIQLMERLADGIDAGETLDRLGTAEPDPLERLRALRRALDRTGAPEAGGSGQVLVARVPAEAATGLRAIALVRAAGRARLVEVTRQGAVRDATPAAIDLVAAAAETGAPGEEPVRRVRAMEVRRIAYRITSHFRSLHNAGRAPASVRPVDPGARVARQILDALADPIAGLQPDVMERGDAILRRLGRPLPVHATAALAALAADPAAAGPVTNLLARVEAVLERLPPGPATAGSAGQAVKAAELVAVLLAGPDASRDSTAASTDAPDSPRRVIDDIDASG